MMEQAIRQTYRIGKNQSIERSPLLYPNYAWEWNAEAPTVFGISANPAMGHTADLISALGGRVILSEFPELCGVEQNIVNRCATPEIGKRFIEIMKNMNSVCRKQGQAFT